MSSLIDGFQINTSLNNNILEFNLSSIDNTIFTLELYSYLGVKKLKFDKINLKKVFIQYLRNEFNNKSYNLNDFFKIITQFNK